MRYENHHDCRICENLKKITFPNNDTKTGWFECGETIGALFLSDGKLETDKITPWYNCTKFLRENNIDRVEYDGSDYITVFYEDDSFKVIPISEVFVMRK